MDVLNEVRQESNQEFEYSDEKILSNIYQVSFSYALRALANMPEALRNKEAPKNEWLVEESEQVRNVAVLDFDNIVKKLKNGKSSCDAFFYNFIPEGEDKNYLFELKNVDKKTVLSLLDINNQDSIIRKVRDSVQMIEKQLEFGGLLEHEQIIEHTHFFIVYAGKNNVPAKNPIKRINRTKVSRDDKGKQKRAGKMELTPKKEDDLLERFGAEIRKLGLSYCDEREFPGKAIPRVKKTEEGKIREFSIFSSDNFEKIITSGFFNNWNWGAYQEFI